APTTCYSAPDQQDNYGPDDRADQAGTLVGSVESQSLAQPGRDECPDDAQDCRQDEARGLILPGCDQLRNDTRDEPDDDRPDYAQGTPSHRSDSARSAGPPSHTNPWGTEFVPRWSAPPEARRGPQSGPELRIRWETTFRRVPVHCIGKLAREP